MIFHSYVSLPKGKIQNEVQSKDSHFVLPSKEDRGGLPMQRHFGCSQWQPVAASGHLQIWRNKIKQIAKGCGRETVDGDDVIYCDLSAVY